jgi:glutathione S-transferase
MLAAYRIDEAAVADAAAVRTEQLQFELHAIAFSHYCDKARWMLQLADIPYTEIRYLPLFHLRPLAALQRRFGVRGRRDVTSSPYSTPILAIYTAEGRPLLLLPDSSIIGRFAELYAARRGKPVGLYSGCCRPAATVPAAGRASSTSSVPPIIQEDADIVRLEKRFHDRLGTAARVVTYRAYLPSARSFVRTDYANVGWLQATAHVLLYPVIALALALVFKLFSSRYTTAMRNRCEEEFAFVDAQLAAAAQASGKAVDAADGPLSMVGAGERVTAADLTFAALGGLCVGITSADGYGAWLPLVADMGNAAHTAWVERMRARPSGRLILRLYHLQRLQLQTAWAKAAPASATGEVCERL